MKKNNVMIVAGICACFLLSAASIVKAEDQTIIVSQVNNELQQEGMTAEEVNAVQASIKEMVNNGESKQQVKNAVALAVSEARAQGLKGKDLAARVHARIQERKMLKTQANEQIRTETQTQTGKSSSSGNGKSSGGGKGKK
ncbi:MAG: hypothetical protein KJ915_02210 [Candidatus Omnitrophica bacterium]|nr:hypothetical protein [Candidatus Omnitrophota bacterium]